MNLKFKFNEKNIVFKQKLDYFIKICCILFQVLNCNDKLYKKSESSVLKIERENYRFFTKKTDVVVLYIIYFTIFFFLFFSRLILVFSNSEVNIIHTNEEKRNLRFKENKSFII